MTEIKIQEHRYLSLIESEKLVPLIIESFLKHLILEWKKDNPFKTEEERKLLEGYLKDKFIKCGFQFEAWFNNNYFCMIQFRYAGEDYFVPVTTIDTSTGLSTE